MNLPQYVKKELHKKEFSKNHAKILVDTYQHITETSGIFPKYPVFSNHFRQNQNFHIQSPIFPENSVRYNWSTPTQFSILALALYFRRTTYPGVRYGITIHNNTKRTSITRLNIRYDHMRINCKPDIYISSNDRPNAILGHKNQIITVFNKLFCRNRENISTSLIDMSCKHSG